VVVVVARRVVVVRPPVDLAWVVVVRPVVVVLRATMEWRAVTVGPTGDGA
jgi:hypothetical protein